jgi:hypothetical protein
VTGRIVPSTGIELRTAPTQIVVVVAASRVGRETTMNTDPEVETMSNEKKTMTPADARRIQSAADKTGRNQDFKSRAQSTADKGRTQQGGKSKK